VNQSDGQSVRESLYTIDEIIKIVSPIAQRYDVKRLWLFGSYARGEATPDSDLDFRVELDEKCGLIKYAGLWLELEEALGMKIDLISTDLSGEEFSKNKFLFQIAKDEVIIYDYKS
jgi:predicted nucleotidyltransferase